jgi:hypothetical protein
MTQQAFLDDWAEWAVVVAFCVSLILPFALMPIWKWWKDSFGVSLQLKDFLVAGALLASFLHFVFGINPEEIWFGYVRNIAISAIPFVLAWRFWIIWKEQRDGARFDRGRRKKDDTTTT